MPDQTLKQRFERRKSALKLEQSSFITHWKDLAQFIQPRRGRFFIEDRNRGGDRYNSIINSKATQAHKTARSGLLAGVASPARPWFKYETNDPDLNNYEPVKRWNYTVQQIILAIFSQSNFYSSTSVLLGEMLLFATGAMVDVDDFEDVSRYHPLTIGSYLIGQDKRRVINTLVREYEMTTSQIVEEFGLSSVSQSVKTAYDNGNYDAWWPVTHIIEPNVEYSGTKKLSRYKKFRSCYYEPGNNQDDQLLSDNGFDDFPAYVPRWDVTGEDVWGTDCPAMTALGDIKGLQIEERRKAQAIDKMVNPPMRGPAALRNVPVDSLPGGLTIYDGDDKNKLEPLYSVNPQVGEMRIDIKAVEDRIDTAFYVHLFRAISDMAGVQPRNQLELQQRDQERLLELGPVLEHLHGEFLSKVVERTFNKGVKHGIFPPAPPELQGKTLNAKFISTLAMAQRAVAAGAIERTATFVASLAPIFPAAVKKFKADQAVDAYADVIGTPPTLIASDDEVAAAQQAEQEAMAKQQQLAASEQMAGAAQKGASAVQALGSTPAGATPEGGDTVLSKLSDAIKQRAAPNLFAAPSGGR